MVRPHAVRATRGQLISNFGPGMDCPALITAWEPLKRFAAEGDMGGPGSPKVATEWSVRARAGGMCLVRVVHSLFASTDDWDNQLDGVEQGWPTYFRILRMYLANFKGMPCSAMQFVGFSTEPESTAWEQAGGACRAPQDRRRTEVGSPTASRGRRSGVAGTRNAQEHRPPPPRHTRSRHGSQPAVLLRRNGDGVPERLPLRRRHRAAVERDEPAWQAWIGERFPMPQMG